MGEYLSTPNKEKHTEEGENGRVSAHLTNFRFVMLVLACRAGEGPWKIVTLSTLTSETESRSSEFSTVTEV